MASGFSVPPDSDSSFTERVRSKLHDHRGLLATFIGALCFATEGILVKLLKGDIPVIQLVCLRFFLTGIFSFLFGMYTSMEFRIQSKREAILLVARTLPSTIGIALFFYSMFNMSVGLATSIVYGSPVFLGIFAWIFIREPFQCRDIVLVIINLAGIVLIAQPPFLFTSEDMDSTKKTELKAIAAAVSAMLLTAMGQLSARLLGLINCSASKMVFYYSMGATVVLAIVGLTMKAWIIPPCGTPRYYIVMVGFVGFIANVLFAYGFTSTKKAYFVSLVNSSEVPVTIVLEIFILEVIPNWISVLGACLVVASALGVVFREGTLIMRRNDKENDHDIVKEEIGGSYESIPLSERNE